MANPPSQQDWEPPNDKSLVEITKAVADDLARGTTSEKVITELSANDDWPLEAARQFVEQIEEEMTQRIAAADAAIGVNGHVKRATSIEGRSEKATWRNSDLPVGGRLTLTQNCIIWRKSRWPGVGWPWLAAPQFLEITLNGAAVSLGPRRPISAILYLLTLLFPFLLFVFLFDLASDGHRRTIQVAFGGSTHLFSVARPDEWIQEIASAKSIP